MKLSQRFSNRRTKGFVKKAILIFMLNLNMMNMIKFIGNVNIGKLPLTTDKNQKIQIMDLYRKYSEENIKKYLSDNNFTLVPDTYFPIVKVGDLLQIGIYYLPEAKNLKDRYNLKSKSWYDRETKPETTRIRYYFDEGYHKPNKKLFVEATTIWEKTTCVKFSKVHFKRYSLTDIHDCKFYLGDHPVLCVTGSGKTCSAMLGKKHKDALPNRAHVIQVPDSCSLHDAVHALGHVLGLEHEDGTNSRQQETFHFNEHSIYESIEFPVEDENAFEKYRKKVFELSEKYAKCEEKEESSSFYDYTSVMQIGSVTVGDSSEPNMIMSPRNKKLAWITEYYSESTKPSEGDSYKVDFKLGLCGQSPDIFHLTDERKKPRSIKSKYKFLRDNVEWLEMDINSGTNASLSKNKCEKIKKCGRHGFQTATTCKCKCHPSRRGENCELQATIHDTFSPQLRARCNSTIRNDTNIDVSQLTLDLDNYNVLKVMWKRLMCSITIRGPIHYKWPKITIDSRRAISKLFHETSGNDEERRKGYAKKIVDRLMNHPRQDCDMLRIFYNQGYKSEARLYCFTDLYLSDDGILRLYSNGHESQILFRFNFDPMGTFSNKSLVQIWLNVTFRDDVSMYLKTRPYIKILKFNNDELSSLMTYYVITCVIFLIFYIFIFFFCCYAYAKKHRRRRRRRMRK